jgi:hypothetical protein
MTPEKREYHRAWRAAHPEQVSAYNARQKGKRRSNPEAYRESTNALYAKLRRDPSWVEKRRQYDRNNYRLKNSVKESTVEEHLRLRTEAAGGMCPKFVDPNRKGAPDRLVVLPGHPTYFVELKRPRKSHTEEWQIRYHEALRKCGQRVWLLKSVEEVDAFFVEIGI